MPVNPQQLLGQVGERLAREHYERLGFRILERNYRTARGELDLIAFDGQTLVFVEVKARRAGGLDPLESVTARKRRRCRALAASWLAERPDRPYAQTLRFDAVAVVIDAGGRLLALDQREAGL